MPKTITQSVYFEAPPAAVYALYADETLHAEVTGAGASIKARAGAAFAAWDDYISGTIIKAEKNRTIIQTWRASDWESEAPDSILVLLFMKEGEGTRLLLAHAGVPDGQAAELLKGWTDFYWKPWKVWIKKNLPARPTSRRGSSS